MKILFVNAAGGDALAVAREAKQRGDEVWSAGGAAGLAELGSRVEVSAIGLWRLVREQRFDLAVVHDEGAWGRLAVKLGGARRVVLHFGGGVPRSLAGCDLAVCSGSFARQQAIERGLPADKIVHIPQGVELRKFAMAKPGLARRKLGFAPGDQVAGVFGPATPEAKAFVRAWTGGARLVLLDEGFRALAGERVHVAEFQPELLAGFDVFVQPGDAETLPATVLEAMGAGRPVVTRDSVCCREVIENGVTGVLAADLAAAVNALLADPERARAMGRRAGDECRTRFSRDRIVRRILGEYDRLTGRPAVRVRARTAPAAS